MRYLFFISILLVFKNSFVLHLNRSVQFQLMGNQQPHIHKKPERSRLHKIDVLVLGYGYNFISRAGFLLIINPLFNWFQKHRLSYLSMMIKVIS